MNVSGLSELCTPYLEKRPVWMPRPERLIVPDQIDREEELGNWAQFKREGTGTLVWRDPTKSVTSMNRHQKEHKAWRKRDQSAIPLEDGLPGRKWWLFAGELMNNKVKNGPKDTLYIFDVLVYDGVMLTGVTFEKRQELLHGLWKAQARTMGHEVITPNFWVARNHTAGLRKLFDSLTDPMDEGLVFKNPRSVLNRCSSPMANAGWQVKARRPKKGRTC